MYHAQTRKPTDKNKQLFLAFLIVFGSCFYQRDSHALIKKSFCYSFSVGETYAISLGESGDNYLSIISLKRESSVLNYCKLKLLLKVMLGIIL